uniref:Uncharacterized protein n=1 Tax=Lepeophtheirus salmonis TaxID=72036 RepID=A0A0K2TQA6_LEPSM
MKSTSLLNLTIILETQVILIFKNTPWPRFVQVILTNNYLLTQMNAHINNGSTRGQVKDVIGYKKC